MDTLLSNSKHKTHIVFAGLDDVASASKVENGIREVLNLDSASLIAGDSSKMIYSIDIGLVELSRCMMANMIAVMMVSYNFV